MFSFVARRLLIATFIVGCAFLLACSTTPEGNKNAGQLGSNAPQNTGGGYEGFFDEADCNTVWGWAWNTKPNEVVFVEILSDGVPVATIPAGEARWSVADHTGDHGYHGFVYTVDPGLKDGKPHIISAKISKTNFELINSPRTINCPPQ